MATIMGNRAPIESDNHATPTPRAAGAGIIDRHGRRGPFGGTNRIALLMGEPDDRPTRSRRGWGHVPFKVAGLPRTNTRGGRSQYHARGRIAKFFNSN
jgi:hypothetical protein